MGDSDSDSDNTPPAVASIASWQRQESSTSQDQAHLDSTQSASARLPLIEQASRFLKDDSIKDAPIKKKIVYLESKGLDYHEIADLLGFDRDTIISTNGTSQTNETEHSQPTEVGSSPVEPKTPTSTEQPPPPAITPSRDPPPIIAYPEFLLHTQKPPPWITPSRLLTSFYAASGAAAIAYGASAVFVKPMVESLNSARHSLLETASTNIQTLNQKLSQTVTNPPSTTPIPIPNQPPSPSPSTSSSLNPTPLFHRSTATQTSPTPSLPSSPKSNTSTPLPLTPLSTQLSHLSILKTQLADLLTSTTRELDASMAVNRGVDAFHHHVDTLYFGGGAARSGDHQDDAVGKVKTEIRGVKGAVLSARSFPGVG